MGDLRSRPDPDHVRRRDRHVRGLSDGARCPYTASLGGAESVPRPIPIPRADSKPDGEPIADTHHRADSQPDRIPHSAGKPGTDCGADSRTDADAGIDSEADSRTDGDAHDDPGTDAHPNPGPKRPSARRRPRRHELAARVVHDARPVAGADVPAAERSKYTVSFAAGGTFSATADCNALTGTWTATATGGLSIVFDRSTIVACGEGSHGDLYVLALSNSASYAIANNGLTITLKDGGTLVYEPGA